MQLPVDYTRPYTLVIVTILGSVYILPAPFAQAQDITTIQAAYKRPSEIPFPPSNPYTPEKAALGKALYFEPRLSGAENMNCATCQKGFAVVAVEVKSLADQTQKATSAIAENIDQVRISTGEVVKVIEAIGHSIHIMGSAADEVASATQGQQSAAYEIAGNTEAAAAGTNSVRDALNTLNETFDQVASGSEKVVRLLENLQTSVKQLRSDSGTFLDQVRAG